MPTLTESLGALGGLEVPFKTRDPALEAELVDSEGRPRLRHLRLQWGEEQLGIFVLTRAIPGDPFVMKGRNMAWWLGDQNRGPLIPDRRYCAGTNKLSNGGFELDGFHWSTDEDSNWAVPSTDAAFSGTNGAKVTASRDSDDVLRSEESFEARSGDTHQVKIRARRTEGDTGRLRLRTVEEGRFKHSNLVPSPGFENGDNGDWGDTGDIFTLVNDADEAKTGDWVLRCRSGQAKPISNGDFETGDFTDWTNTEPGTGLWTVQNSTVLRDSWTAQWDPSADASSSEIHQEITVKGGERWKLDFIVQSETTDRDLYIGVEWRGGDEGNEKKILRTIRDTEENAYHHELELSVPDGRTSARIRFIGPQPAAGSGRWWLDNVRIVRTQGNVRVFRSALFDVTPELRYSVKGHVRFEDGVAGEISWAWRFSADGRDSVFVESGKHIKASDTEWQELEADMNPPSGYNRARLQIRIQDVFGGYAWVDDMSVKQEDETIRVSDLRIGPTQADWAEFSRETTAPTGITDVRWELVAEQDCEGWEVDEASLARVCTPVEATTIVSDLLKHDGNQLVNEGTLHDAGTIAFDWTIENLFNREALDDLSREGFVSPKREWRINSDGELDWGIPSEVFTDRDTSDPTPMIVTDGDAVVEGAPDIERDAEGFSTEVKLIGTERTTAHGRKTLITGEATNDDLGLTDFFGNPIVRTHLVEDGSVNHHDFADLRAEDVAADDVAPSQSLDLTLRDWRAVTRFDVGDWGYFYFPDQGVLDESNEMPYWAGGTIYPARLRILDRDWTLGNGPFRAFLMRSATDEIEVTDSILWPSRTSARITVGDPRPDFTTSPQGGGLFAQYLRFRRSTTRD